jgi:hypothetical protein
MGHPPDKVLFQPVGPLVPPIELQDVRQEGDDARVDGILDSLDEYLGVAGNRAAIYFPRLASCRASPYSV